MDINKLQDDFKLLRDHCIIIRRNYNTYTNLFFQGNDELLLKVAWRFFNDIAEIMCRDWILQVCKLMDPAEYKFKNQNISITLIDTQLRIHNLQSPEMVTVSDELCKYGSKLIPARNKRIAHFDREQHLIGLILGETTEEELLSFIKNIQHYCDLVGNAIGIGPLDFSGSGSSGDELDLITVLRKIYDGK